MCGRVCVCPLQPQICSDTAGLTDDDKKKRKEPLIYSPTMHLHGSRAAPDLGDGEGYSLQDLIQLNVIPRILTYSTMDLYDTLHNKLCSYITSSTDWTEASFPASRAKNHLRSQRKQIYSSVFPTFYFIFIANTIDLTSLKKPPGLHKRFKVIWSTFIVTDFSSVWVLIRNQLVCAGATCTLTQRSVL